ncbi:hypothetical protein D9757_013380 [Collybiopsis confluens]|uniref:Uncharacterized protein n=1 Tax=Collybiopsis confluens TaxID=2823264 RepID=A0A8H5CRM1_9AGAR|nr:hypothetical protein D9757_013380 [Collybiopsis confluens]
MLAVIRFAATKDLKYIQGKVCKPYNSVFEEHFRAHWDVPPLVVTGDDEPPVAQILVTAPTTGFAPPESTFLPPSDTANIKSSKSGRSSKSFMSSLTPKSPSTAATLPHQHAEGAQMSQLHLGGSSPPSEDQKLRVVYLTEQISHYPPVPADYAACPFRLASIRVLPKLLERRSRFPSAPSIRPFLMDPEEAISAGNESEQVPIPQLHHPLLPLSTHLILLYPHPRIDPPAQPLYASKNLFTLLPATAVVSESAATAAPTEFAAFSPIWDMLNVKSVSGVDRSFLLRSAIDGAGATVTAITVMFLVVGPTGSKTAALSTPSTSSVTEGVSTSAAVTDSASAVSQALVSSSPAVFSPTTSASPSPSR